MLWAEPWGWEGMRQEKKGVRRGREAVARGRDPPQLRIQAPWAPCAMEFQDVTHPGLGG